MENDQCKTPEEMLRLLMARLQCDGMNSTVAEMYADEIRRVLGVYYPSETEKNDYS